MCVPCQSHVQWPPTYLECSMNITACSVCIKVPVPPCICVQMEAFSGQVSQLPFSIWCWRRCAASLLPLSALSAAVAGTAIVRKEGLSTRWAFPKSLLTNDRMWNHCLPCMLTHFTGLQSLGSTSRFFPFPKTSTLCTTHTLVGAHQPHDCLQWTATCVCVCVYL